MKLPGTHGLRVGVPAPGEPLGAAILVPELDWVAQSVPYYGYMLEAPEPAAVLAGGHCVPVRLPRPGRLVWQNLYSSTQRKGFPEKAAKGRSQSLTLAAMLTDEEPGALEAAFADAPPRMITPIRPLAESLVRSAAAHRTLCDTLRACLACAGNRPGQRPGLKAGKGHVMHCSDPAAGGSGPTDFGLVTCFLLASTSETPRNVRNPPPKSHL